MESRATFQENTEGFGVAPHAIPLPARAAWTDPCTGSISEGVIIRAECGNNQIFIGFRPFAGGNVLALLGEFVVHES